MIYKITIHSNIDSITIQARGDQTLRQSLLKNGIISDYPCNGRGTCGKCKAKLLSCDREILLCKTFPNSDMDIEIYDSNRFEFRFFRKASKKVSIACDIGTTTIEFSAIDGNGDITAKAKMLNPQRMFGADVLSRVSSCLEFGVDSVRKPLITALNMFIDALKGVDYEFYIDKVVICANSVLSHIFAGITPESLAKYPYEMVFDDIRLYEGSKFGIGARTVEILPTFSAFIGSDVLVGLANMNILSENFPVIYMDIGTNGEIALYDGNRVYLATTSAGPCFEGVNISRGMGGVSGAISSVYDNEGKVGYNVIGETEAIGVCGAGLISAISFAKDKMLIDASGIILSGDKIEISERVSLIQKDINEFMLAKSAIRTGIDILLKQSNLSEKDIKNVYVAGNLGQFAEVYSIVNSGIMSPLFRNKLIKVGQNAIVGLEEYIKNPKLLKRIDEIKSRSVLVDLTSNSDFEKEFTKNINV